MKKKLIEVALPLEAINRESAREKSIRHGHPSTLHLWWARRPLAACRAVLFASLVDDPSSLPEEFSTEEAQEKERQRLFGIIEELVKWENSNNERVLDAARKEILKSTCGDPPLVLDPFCGGGSIPLEAQRLGLESHGSDLNPVAVLITKALVEMPPKFANLPPVNSEAKKNLTHSAKWKGAQGLADDVRYYGKWMRDEAEKRIGHLYPKAVLNDGREVTVIAWLWARTVKCPNPACGASMPLIRSLDVARKAGNHYRVLLERDNANVRFAIGKNSDAESNGTITRSGAVCAICGSAVDLEYIRLEGRERRIGLQLMAIVAEDARARAYLAPNDVHAKAAAVPPPADVPETSLPDKALGFRVQAYGMTRHSDLFTPRQLTALTTFSDLVAAARARVLEDALTDCVRTEMEASSYADAVSTYLAFLVDKLADLGNSLCRWEPIAQCPRQLFARQTVSMVWDFAEANPFSDSSGSWNVLLDNLDRSLRSGLFDFIRDKTGKVRQLDAAVVQPRALVCTDPPYYDNIGYAALSDFFYVWLRRSLFPIYPSLMSTLLVPKERELIADEGRHGTRQAAEQFFENGMRSVFQSFHSTADTRYPITLFYAFRQAEDDDDVGAITRASTGWETMLEAIRSSGFLIDGTWPVRTEASGRMRAQNSNALASSVVLVCRARPESAGIATRREFINALKSELPKALKNMQHGSIAPVDLAQASIGPGMSIFTRYAKVMETDGSPMRVRSALQIINQVLDEVLSEQESEYDADTQWAVAWFDQFGTSEAPFGAAETLSKAKNTSVGGLVESGLLRAAKGKVQLIAREQLDADWDPATDKRLTIWEVTQHLIRRLTTGGEQAAAELLRKVGGMGEIARDLAYRLYAISASPRKGWTEEAIAYNSLVVAWPEISRLASQESKAPADGQMTLT